MFTSLRRFTLSFMTLIALASCGGGTSQIEPFVARRYIAFGDELSSFTVDGRKYSINALNADNTAFDCAGNPIWIQTIAEIYGFGFTECPIGTGEQRALTRAAPGAKAADLVLQIDAQVAAGGFVDRDIVSVLVGMHDIKELYERFPAESADDLVAIARERGVLIGRQVNRLIDLGARVIISTAPDVGVTPYGLAQGTEGARLLTRLSDQMNGRIRVTFLNDGRFVGLVAGDEWLKASVRSPSGSGLVNVTTAACNVALPDCSTATLVTDASTTTWLWADDLRLSPAAHSRLGSLASARARNNPF
jgi:hypothetical protein